MRESDGHLNMRLFSFLILITVSISACSFQSTPITPTRTPRPTITATPAATTAPTEVLPPTQASTPTLTPAVTDSALTPTDPFELSVTPEPSPTTTRQPVIVRPTLAPLTIVNILLVKVERDSTRENGAIASLQVVYSGGRAPYTIFHDDTLQPANPFQVLTLCNGTLVHTLRLTSGDKQVVTKQYYLSPIECPP